MRFVKTIRISIRNSENNPAVCLRRVAAIIVRSNSSYKFSSVCNCGLVEWRQVVKPSSSKSIHVRQPVTRQITRPRNTSGGFDRLSRKSFEPIRGLYDNIRFGFNITTYSVSKIRIRVRERSLVNYSETMCETFRKNHSVSIRTCVVNIFKLF